MSLAVTLLDAAKVIAPGILTLLGIWYNSYQQKKNKPDLGKTVRRSDIARPILEGILYELDANRCNEWAVSNGDVTLGGHHLQKLSMVTEIHTDDLDSMQKDFQLVPITQFRRPLESLSAADWIVIHNSQIPKDDLTTLSARYDIETSLIVKVKGEYSKWVGLLSISWKSTREVTDEDIVFVKTQAARLGAIKS